MRFAPLLALLLLALPAHAADYRDVRLAFTLPVKCRASYWSTDVYGKKHLAFNGCDADSTSSCPPIDRWQLMARDTTETKFRQIAMGEFYFAGEAVHVTVRVTKPTRYYVTTWHGNSSCPSNQVAADTLMTNR